MVRRLHRPAVVGLVDTTRTSSASTTRSSTGFPGITELSARRGVRRTREYLGCDRSLKAQRIAHRIRAVEDAELMDHLIRNGIARDVCPTSNWRLGAVHVESEHPIKTLHREGVTVTINSDDPSLVNTTLSDEIGLLSSHFGLSLIEIDAILENGIEASFLAPAGRWLRRHSRQPPRS